MEFFQWLRQVVCRLCQRFIRPLNYDNESTLAQRSSGLPVHQLWPLSEGNQRTELDVVLFHGLQLTANDTSDAWSSTWTQRGHDDICWPREWLPYDLGKPVRIFSVSYNADIATSPPHDHVSEIAHNLLQSLMNPRYEWHRPIVLIGHSFGGLVLKSLVVQLKRASTNTNLTDLWSKDQQQSVKLFLSNVRGVAFYAVPHAGSSNIPKYVNKLLKCNSRDIPGIMRNIQPSQGDMEQLSVDFGRIVTEKEICIYAFCEGRPMEQLGILVDATSARRAAEDNFYKIEDADHMEVCKPPSKEHSSYGQLLQFILTCGKASREFEQALQEVHDLRESTFGLESYIERVETLVTSAGSDESPKYVGVWGMGGVGKTVFLQTLYASARVHDHFQGVQFIRRTVGQSPNILSLYRSLSEELNLKPQENLNAEDYKHKLLSMFKQERVFLVLDDIWEDKVFDSLDLAKGKGSVTLLSTRNQSLFERASPQITQVHITPLSNKDSWSLFCVHAFSPPSNVPDELRECAKSMAEECQGLALALKVIGKAMSGKRSLELDWLFHLKKLRRSCLQEKTVKKKLYERLKLGYDVLSEVDWRLNVCFHYFAGFPENSQICFEEILFHWVGEGLVPTDDEDDPTADAFSLLKILLDRSLIESNAQSGADMYNLMKLKYSLNFKLHDVMRDLALYILEKDCGIPPIPPAKQLYFYRAGRNWGEVPKDWKILSEARRISLDTNKLERLPKSLCARNLVSLLLGRNPIISLPANFSSNFPMLRVLNLRNGQFHSLPEELGDLQNLVCLDLSNCHDLDSLPNSVRKLHELKFLILDDCWSLKCLPSGVGDLTSLQVLHTAQCSSLIWAENILSWTAIAGSSYLHPTVGASLENVCRLLLLTELTISSKQMFEIPDVFKQFRDEVTHNIYSPTTLQLIQQALLPNELPHNICSLTKLQLLQISLEIKTLPAEMVDHCIQLQELELRSSILEYLPRSFTCCGAFPALIRLQLSSSSLFRFPEVDEGAMCKLRILNLSNCRRLESLPLSLQLLTSLRSLIVVGCNKKLKNYCRTNCESSAIWRELHILYKHSVFSTQNDNERRYTFHSRYDNKLTLMNIQWRM